MRQSRIDITETLATTAVQDENKQNIKAHHIAENRKDEQHGPLGGYGFPTHKCNDKR